MAENLGVNYSENLGVSPFPIRKRPIFSGDISAPASESPAPMNVDYSTSILELLSPAEKAALAQQAKNEWDAAQARVANRLSEMRKRSASLPSGITYDSGDKTPIDTPELIDQQEIAPLRARYAQAFPSLEKQQNEIEQEARRKASENYIASTISQRAFNERQKGFKDEQDYLEKQQKEVQAQADKNAKEQKLSMPKISPFRFPTQEAKDWLAAHNETAPSFEKTYGAIPSDVKMTNAPASFQGGNTTPPPPVNPFKTKPANRLWNDLHSEFPTWSDDEIGNEVHRQFPSEDYMPVMRQPRASFTPPAISGGVSGIETLPTQISTQAEYDSLPVGAAYIDSNGKRAVKKK